MSALAFTHHPRFVDEKAWTYDASRAYVQDERGGPKPKGFWLSVDDDWRRWCESEEFHTPVPAPVYFSVDMDRCIVLGSVADIDRFDLDYTDGYRTKWATVASEFAGIVIAPYQWARRLDGRASDWYYTWDCASACVWDLSAVCVQEMAS